MTGKALETITTAMTPAQLADAKTAFAAVPVLTASTEAKLPYASLANLEKANLDAALRTYTLNRAAHPCRHRRATTSTVLLSITTAVPTVGQKF